MAQEGPRPCAPAGTALVIVDMISAFCFEDAAAIREPARKIAQTIRHLRNQADLDRVPTIYVNDHFGRWHAERTELVASASEGHAVAQEVAQLLAPRDRDYFVIKPQFSGFYATACLSCYPSWVSGA
jgi:nicotinamidase-related amidase